MMNTIILFLAATVPAIALMIYVYNQDRIEKEPGSMIGKMIFGGVLAALIAIVLEYIFEELFTLIDFSTLTQYAIAEAVMVGVCEESAKYLMLRKYSWNSPEFNFRFDGIVYAVMVSLGFAMFENIIYVFEFGLSVALARALLAIPGHMTFSVIMGIYYGRAKAMDVNGREVSEKKNVLLGLGGAIVLHAFYDGTLMIGTAASLALFVVFVILMYLLVFRTIRKEAKQDGSIY